MTKKGKKERVVTANADNVATEMATKTPFLEITFRGEPSAVKAAIHSFRLEDAWDQGVARQIACDQTLIADVTVVDTLGGPKVQMFCDDDIKIYLTRCCNETAKIGHTVADPTKIKLKGTTTVGQVGDALFANAG